MREERGFLGIFFKTKPEPKPEAPREPEKDARDSEIKSLREEIESLKSQMPIFSKVTRKPKVSVKEPVEDEDDA